MAAAAPPVASLTDKRILSFDGELLAIDKPPGLVVHATVDTTRDHLVGAAHRWLRARDPAAPAPTLLHRLDRDTSGVVLLSCARDLDAPLAAAFAERRVDKRYLAIVRARPGVAFPEGERRDFLAPGRGPGGRTLVVRSGGKPAITELRVVARTPSWLLVQARPHTGRTHQIRVHLAESGFSILGDDLYGSPDPDAKRLMLHAWRLVVPDPRTGEPLPFEAPLPRAFRARFPEADLPAT